MTEATNTLFSTLVLGALILLVLNVFVALISRPYASWLYHLLSKKALYFAFLFAFLGMAGSLWYSEVIGFTPCRWCWFSRIAMYPLPVILFVALLRKSKDVFWYAMPLAAIGFIISTYHYLLQFGVFTPGSGCSSGGISAGCAGRYILEYNFITIPFMAGVMYVLIALFLGIHMHSVTKRGENEQLPVVK